MTESQSIQMDPSSLKEMSVDERLKVPSCYQCKRCTNGCPVTFAMDIYPDRVIRLVNLGQWDRVLNCNTIWICSSCETCTTRCPNEVDIAGVMDDLKEMAIQYGVPVPQPQTHAFHDAFLRDIERRGRVFEGRMMQDYFLKSGNLFGKLMDGTLIDYAFLGLNLFRKGRLPLLPEGIKDRKKVRELIGRAR